MKALPLILALLLFAVPSFADTSFEVPHGPSGVTIDDNGIVAGVIFDAPNLVGITKNFNLGVEGSKTLLENPFDPETRSYVDANDNYSVMAKVTYTGCFFRCDL